MGRKVARGAAILLVAGIVARVLGFLYRAYLSREIGAQGMGLMAMAYPVMGLALNLSSAGVPFAVAKMVAERLALPGRRVDRLLRFSFRFVFASGIALGAGLVLVAPYLAGHTLTDPRAYYPLVASAPLVLIVPVAGVMRSYFQGRQEMHPSAVATVVEQGVRIATVLFFVGYFLPYGLEWGAAGAMLGIALGELAGLGVLLLFYRLPQAAPQTPPPAADEATEGPWAIAREVLGLGLPVTATRLMGSLTEIGDAAIVPRRLEVSGLSRDAATAFYGTLSGMALPLLFFPGVVTAALAAALMPAISEAAAVGGLALVRQRTQQALRATLWVALPAAAIFLVLGHPLGRLIYGQAGVGNLVVPLALFAPFLYLENTLSAVLRGLGRPSVPMVNGLVGSCSRLAVIYLLTALPGGGQRAVILGIGLDLGLSFILNYRSLARLVGLRAPFLEWLKIPLLATGAMALALHYGPPALASLGMGAVPALLGALTLGAALYALTLYAGGELAAWP